jgi:hypothetical protein
MSELIDLIFFKRLFQGRSGREETSPTGWKNKGKNKNPRRSTATGPVEFMSWIINLSSWKCSTGSPEEAWHINGGNKKGDRPLTGAELCPGLVIESGFKVAAFQATGEFRGGGGRKAK